MNPKQYGQWAAELTILIRELMRGDEKGHFPLSEIRAIALYFHAERWPDWDMVDFRTRVDWLIQFYMPADYSPVPTLDK